MKGIVLDFNEKDATGLLRGEDGERYVFNADDLKISENIAVGSSVDFVCDGAKAKDIFVLENESVKQSAKQILESSRDLAGKAGVFVKTSNLKTVVCRWFDSLCQFGVIIVTLGYTIGGFIVGGSSGYGGFNIGMAIGGSIAGFLLGLLISVLTFGVLFTLIETRDASKRSAQLLEELLKK